MRIELSGLLAITAMFVWLALTLAPETSAAQTQPIYPTYEGWTANPDGTSTLVFGYHNANAVAVEIPPGPANGFLGNASAVEAPEGDAEPHDLGQPTLFLPGRQRSVCRLVVPQGFSGNLVWRLGFADVVTDTTEKGGLDPLYLLEEIGPGYRATRDIDTATAPKARCLNRAPTVSAGRAAGTTLGEPIELNGFVADDGLPREGGLTVVWKQRSGPGATTFSDPAAASTQARFSVAGAYELELSASDSELSSSSTVAIEVTAPSDVSGASPPR